jgi:hypothetical protein
MRGSSPVCCGNRQFALYHKLAELLNILVDERDCSDGLTTLGLIERFWLHGRPDQAALFPEVLVDDRFRPIRPASHVEPNCRVENGLDCSWGMGAGERRRRHFGVQIDQIFALYSAYDALIGRGFAGYLDREDWFQTVSKLIDRKAGDAFWKVCDVIAKMVPAYAPQFCACGIVEALINVVKTRTSALREAACFCLGRIMGAVPLGLCQEIAEMGALAAICDVVTQARFRGVEAPLRAILILATAHSHWREIAQDAGLELVPIEGDEADEECQELMAAVMGAVFPDRP